MKPFRLIALLATTFLIGANAAESAKPNDCEDDAPTSEKLALVTGFSISGKLTQVIGGFSTYIRPQPGDAFELDFGKLPEGRINFTNSGQDKGRGYIPFHVPLVIEGIRREVPVNEPGIVTIHLSARDASNGQTFLIQVWVNRLENGGKATVCFSQTNSGVFMGSMAAGEAVLGGKKTVTENMKPASPPFKSGMRNVEPPVGSLGFKIGSYLTIEGVREEVAKGAIRYLRVDTINGYKLEQPVPIWMNGVELPEKERCIFKGYETGEWIGVPEEVLHATGRPAPQAGWQFKFSFSPTSVEVPKTVEIK